MAQVIQGNNLRCLFTDNSTSPAPSRSSYPSSLNGHQPYAHPQQQQAGYAVGSYGHRPGAGSLYSTTSAPIFPVPSNASVGRRISGRDEIILVSDDRVLTLRMSALR